MSITRYSLIPGYEGTVHSLLTFEPTRYYLRTFLNILFGINWGLIFTGPFILIAVVSLCCFRIPMKEQFFICLIPMAVNFYLLLLFVGTGSWYGYRYFISSMIPLMVFPLAFFLKWAEIKFGRKALILCGLVAVFPTLSMLCFQGNNTNLTLSVVPGLDGWRNDTYQLEVWKTLIFTPFEFLIVIFKGGLLYVLYVISHMFNALHLLPDIVYEKYQGFQLRVLIRTVIIYTLPFILYGITQNFTNIKNKSFKN